MATIWRWREHYQHDFAARMDWCVAREFKQANHNPIAVLNGDATKRVLQLTARPGDAVQLSARGSRDPDGDALKCGWLVYREAGTYPAEIQPGASTGEETVLIIPIIDLKGRKNPTLHVILTVQDNGRPSLFAYRRAVITVKP